MIRLLIPFAHFNRLLAHPSQFGTIRLRTCLRLSEEHQTRAPPVAVNAWGWLCVSVGCNPPPPRVYNLFGGTFFLLNEMTRSRPSFCRILYTKPDRQRHQGLTSNKCCTISFSWSQKGQAYTELLHINDVLMLLKMPRFEVVAAFLKKLFRRKKTANSILGTLVLWSLDR